MPSDPLPGVGAAVRTGNLRRCDKHYIPAFCFLRFGHYSGEPRGLSQRNRAKEREKAVMHSEYFSSIELINKKKMHAHLIIPGILRRICDWVQGKLVFKFHLKGNKDVVGILLSVVASFASKAL